jgi:sialate O-acetylesterase
VSSPAVAKPVAVRYAWSDNPVCNVYSAEGLPVTPFRTDDFPMITDPANPNSVEAQNAKRAEELKKLMEARKKAGKK